MLPEPSTPTVTDIINQRLDALYEETAGKILEQVEAMTLPHGTPLQQALVGLQEEVDNLDKDDKILTPDNAYIARVMDAFRTVIRTTAGLIAVHAGSIEDTGIQTGIAAVSAKVLTQYGVDFPEVLPEAEFSIKGWEIPEESAFIKVSRSRQWTERMNSWADGFMDYVQEQSGNRLEHHNNTDYLAWIRNTVVGIPFYSTENITRTLQLTGYRNATVTVEVENSNFIAFKIRTAQLDVRTCLSCIALHGQVLPIGFPISDHYRGRCSAYYVVVGGKEQPDVMKVEIRPDEFEFVPFQTGEEWFAGLPEERQLQQASFEGSPGKFNAYKAGNPLSSFVLHKHDEVFEDMVFEDSIIGAFGADAEKYYSHNQGE